MEALLNYIMALLAMARRLPNPHCLIILIQDSLLDSFLVQAETAAT